MTCIFTQLGPVSMFDKTSYCKISHNLEALRLVISIIQSLWNLTGICCWCAYQISKRWDSLNHQSRGFETSQFLATRRLILYWNGALTNQIDRCLSYIYERHLSIWLVRIYSSCLFFAAVAWKSKAGFAIPVHLFRRLGVKTIFCATNIVDISHSANTE